MKLIADSGSTSTDWYLINNNEPALFKTEGYNPYYFSSEEVAQSIQQTLQGQFEFESVQHVQFYGAGCSNQQSAATIQKALASLFSKASIELADDLIAAARATAGKSPGICCILGTGSNSCVYDGQSIVHKIPSLGYILGDEGAGSQIGKALISSYFYQEMPSDLAVYLESFYQMDKHHIITTLFNHKNPNRYLASFAAFCVQHQQHSFVKQLVKTCFGRFLKRHVLKYPESAQLPIHFVGSIAYGFQAFLQEALQEAHLSQGNVLKSPFPALLNY